MSFTTAQVEEAAREALGRQGAGAKDKALYAMYKDFGGGSLDALKRAFAASPEAAKAGVAGEKFGVQYVDPATLNEKDKKLYDAFQRGWGKSARLSMTMLENFRDNGSPEYVEALGKGDIKEEYGNGLRTLVVTAPAWKQYGAGLLSGLHTSEAVRIEKGAGSAKDLETAAKAISGRWRQYTKGAEDDGSFKDAAFKDGSYVLYKEAAKHSGLLGGAAKAMGLGSGAANSLDRAVGQVAAPLSLIPQTALMADEIAVVGGGTRGAEARIKTLVRAQGFVGIGEKSARRNVQYFDTAGDVATAIVAGVIDASGGMGVASAANQAAQVGEKAVLDEKIDWTREGIDLALNFIPVGLSKWKAAAGSAKSLAAAEAAQTVWARGGAGLARSLAEGGNMEDHAWALGAGFVTSFLPNDVATRATAGFALGYADARRRGISGEAAMLHASAQSASMAALAAVDRRPRASVGEQLRQTGRTFGNVWREWSGADRRQVARLNSSPLIGIGETPSSLAATRARSDGLPIRPSYLPTQEQEDSAIRGLLEKGAR